MMATPKRGKSIYKYPVGTFRVVSTSGAAVARERAWPSGASVARDAEGSEGLVVGAFWSATARAFEGTTESLKKTEALLAELERAVKETSL